MNPEEMSAHQFAEAIAALGAEGKSQEQIADALGMTKSQVRWRLLNSGYSWTSEVLVKLSLTGEVVRPVQQEAVAA